MTFITPKFVAVPDAITGEDVPALVTSENEDGTVNVTVFGTSDVIEKRVNVETTPAADDATDDAVDPNATGKRRAAATDAKDGESA